MSTKGNGNSNNKPLDLGSLSGGGGGTSAKNIFGSVTYTTPTLNLTPNSGVNLFANRSGDLTNFSTNTGSNTFGVGYTYRF
jgi:hypothetical protein